MNDVWLYIVIFVLGAVVALIDHAAMAVECKLNKRLLKFLPVRHIPTAIAVVLAFAAFIYYGWNPETGRTTSVSILCVALAFLAVTVILDICIIFIKRKK